MNKSLITNTIAILLILVGYYISNSLLFTIGLFAFSGAITNWLAIHMLFEKIPGLYGSGVIPARFEDFKSAIRNMMMEQFFNQKNLDRFMKDAGSKEVELVLAPVIEKVDLSPAFDQLIKTIMESSFGGMLGMLGGQEALLPLKEPFMANMKESLIEMTNSPEFDQLLRTEMQQQSVSDDIREKVSGIIEQRLEELTPQTVKEIVQAMIKQHLGWLVVWGGVFGGVIGGLSTLITY
ncbi:MAG: DUF445 domain-containing protein [Kangiellaceae bacterium]|nr:DUF445 domain-containing protein [Kangiellaceae bacterium]